MSMSVTWRRGKFSRSNNRHERINADNRFSKAEPEKSYRIERRGRNRWPEQMEIGRRCFHRKNPRPPRKRYGRGGTNRDAVRGRLPPMVRQGLWEKDTTQSIQGPPKRIHGGSSRCPCSRFQRDR